MHIPLLKLVISSGSLIKTKSLLNYYGITSATPNPDTGEPFIFIAIDSHQNELFEHLAVQEKDNITKIMVFCSLKQDAKGNTVLLRAIENENIEVVKFLLKNFRDLSCISNNIGKTPLMLASQLGLPVIVEQLLNAGSKIKERDLTGSSALH
jgi:ankyrin repeat protein